MTDAMLRRLRLRSTRRGIREMDLILGAFAGRRLAELSAEELALYEALLDQPDQDLLDWIAGRSPPPTPFAALVARIADETRRLPQRLQRGDLA